MKKWSEIPDEEIERLDKTLSIHLRKMKVKKSKPERIEKIKEILRKQKFTQLELLQKECTNQ